MKNIIEQLEKLLSNENINESKKLVKKLKGGSNFYYYMGEIKRVEGLIEEAKKYYNRVFKEEKQNREILVNSIIRLISIYRAEGNISQSYKLIKEAKRLVKNDERLDLEIAMYYRMKGDFKKAIEMFMKIERRYKISKDFAGISYIKWAMAGIKRLNGDFNESIRLYKQAINYAIKGRDYSLKIYSLLGLGGVLRVSGRISKSYETYYKTFKLLGNDDLFAKAYAYCGMANGLRQMGKFTLAIKNYKKSLQLYSRIGDRLDLALVLWGLGECYKRKMKLPEALFYFKKADKLFKTGFEPRGMILNQISISHTLYLSGRKEEAKRIFFDAIKKAKKYKLNTYLEIFT